MIGFLKYYIPNLLNRRKLTYLMSEGGRVGFDLSPINPFKAYEMYKFIKAAKNIKQQKG